MPKDRRNKSASRSKAIALSGMLAALALVILLFGGFIPIATFTAPAFAGLCLLPIALEVDGRTSALAYLAVSLLSLFIVADKELALFFVFLLGYYPILHARLTKICHKLPQYLLKLAIFNAATILVYLVLLFVIASPAMVEEFASASWGFTLGLLALGNVTFVLYDILLGRLKLLYIIKFKGRFFR